MVVGSDVSDNGFFCNGASPTFPFSPSPLVSGTLQVTS